MLKNVVLPAPFGPISETMAFFGTSKSTSSLATSQPNSLRSCTVSRRAVSGTGDLVVVERFVADALVQLCRASLRGDLALRPEEHRQHEDDAEDAELVLRDVDRTARVVPEPGADVREPLAVEIGEEARAEDDTGDAAHPAEDDHAEDEDRDVEEEVVRERAALVARVVRAGDAAEERARRIGPGLRPHQRNAHRRGGGLVLADRDPRAAEPRVAQPHRAEDREQDEPDRRPEVEAVEVRRGQLVGRQMPLRQRQG